MSESTGREFMKKTCYKYLDASDQEKGLPQPPLQVEVEAETALIDLPDPAGINIPPLDLRRAIEERQSVRQYAQTALSLAELSYLLWCTQGVHEVGSGGYYTRRTVPSAGARHAFETYLLVNHVDGLTPGLYRFLAIEHKLAVVDLSPDLSERFAGACWGQKMVQFSSATFVWVAVPYRMAWRYGQRGYRYLHLDAGHVCQNLYLAAESMGCGVCAIGAFSDEELSAALGVDGVEQFPIYAAAVGKMR